MTTQAKRESDAAYYRANRERIRTYQREWRAKNAEKLRADKAAYHIANGERIRAKVKAWNETHPGVTKARTAAWAIANPARKRELDHRRRVRLEDICDHAACVALGPVQLAWQANPRRCYMCGSHNNLQMDHLVPLALGGLHCAENLRPACAPCNQSKGARWISYDSPPPEDWGDSPLLLRFVGGPGVPPDDYFVVPAKAWLAWFGKDE